MGVKFNILKTFLFTFLHLFHSFPFSVRGAYAVVLQFLAISSEAELLLLSTYLVVALRLLMNFRSSATQVVLTK